MRHARELLRQAAADHQLDDLRHGEVSPPRPPPTLWPSRSTVKRSATCCDFFEEVADVDDGSRRAPRSRSIEREQPFGVLLRQRTGRLIEDENAHVDQQRAGDLDELLRRRD